MKILSDKNGVLNVEMGKSELQVFLQNILEKTHESANATDEQGEDVVDSSLILLMLGSIEPAMKYALPFTVELFNEIKSSVESAELPEELEGEDLEGEEEGTEGEFDPDQFEDENGAGEQDEFHN